MLDKDFETRVLACLYRSTEFCSVGVEYLKPKYFTSNMANNLAKLAMDFYRKYKTPITQQGFVDGLNYLVGKQIVLEGEKREYANAYMTLAKTDVTDHKYTLDKLLDFIKESELRILIKDSVESYLPNGDYKTIETKISEITNISANVSIQPKEYRETLEERIGVREERKGVQVRGIPTGIDKLDEALGYRGWVPGELYAFAGPAKSGKSMALGWCANYAAILGNNVAYFTLEVSDEVIFDRTDAMNADIEINSLGHYNNDVRERVMNMDFKGKLFVYDYPTKRCSVADIERQVKLMETHRGIRFDLVVVDYLQIMRMPSRMNDKWEQQEAVAEDLRGFAKEMQMPVLTAVQINRSGNNKAVVTGADVAGSYAVVGVVDGLLTLGGKRDMMDRGELILRLSEFRNAPSRMIRIKTDYGCGKFYKEYLGEEYE